MKPIVLGPNFQKKLRQLSLKDRKQFERVRKTLKMFHSDPKHPSLRLHRLKGDLKNTWSMSVSMSVRILFAEGEEYYLFDIGTHDQVYK